MDKTHCLYLSNKKSIVLFFLLYLIQYLLSYECAGLLMVGLPEKFQQTHIHNNRDHQVFSSWLNAFHYPTTLKYLLLYPFHSLFFALQNTPFFILKSLYNDILICTNEKIGEFL